MASENQNRLQSFKNKGKDQDDMRRRRSEVSIELRKNKREETILKRRNLPNMDVDTDEEPVQLPIDMNLKKLAEVLADYSQPEQQLAAVKAARRLLLLESKDVSDIIPTLVGCLQMGNTALQFEAAWTLTNITSGSSEVTNEVVAAGAVPLLIQLLSSTEPNVCKEAVWALGNIIGDGPKLRDYTIQQGVVKSFVSLIQLDTPISVLGIVTWAFTKLCRINDPPPPNTAILEILRALYELIHHTDPNILADTVWALCYLTDSGNDRIQMVIESCIVPKMVTLLGHTDGKVQKGAIRAVANIATGSDEQTQYVLDCDALKYIPALLIHAKVVIRKDSVWFLSNIAAGNQTQVEAVIDGGFIPKVIDMLCHDQFAIQKEAASVIGNVILSSNRERIFALIGEGIIRPFCGLLACEDTEATYIVLDAICDILKMAGDRVKDVVNLIEECDGVRKIERLQTHECEEIYQLAYKILDMYFSNEVAQAELQPGTTDQEFEFVPNSTNKFNF